MRARALVELGRVEQAAAVWTSLGDRQRHQAEGLVDYWAGVAAAAAEGGQYDVAVPAMLAAVGIDGRDPEFYLQLSQWAPKMTSLGSQDRQRLASQASQRYTRVVRAVDGAKLLRTRTEATDMWPHYIDHLENLGRPLEAIGWTVALSHLDPVASAIDRRRVWREAESRLRALADGTWREDARRYRRVGLSPDRVPPPSPLKIAAALPRAAESSPATDVMGGSVASEKGSPSDRPSSDRPSSDRPPSDRPSSMGTMSSLVMIDRARDLGIDHAYINAEPRRLDRMRIFEGLGGGVAVFDLDADGRMDLYLAQGGGDLPDRSPGVSDQMWVNAGEGSPWREVAAAAGLDERGYTLGVAAGDVNEDGWTDLVIGNDGPNALMINQGDGTFRRDGAFDGGASMTASVVVADVDGDGSADVFEANYVDDPKSRRFPREARQGVPATISPNHFRNAINRLHRSVPGGGFDAAAMDGPDAGDGGEARSSLGLLAADFDGDGRCDLFVGNDAVSNRLYRRIESDGNRRAGSAGDRPAEPGRDRWVDAAKLWGLDRDRRGMETASMGLALADWGGGPMPDVHVTNFDHQSSTLYVDREGGGYRDVASRAGDLEPATTPLVGFGTVAEDFDGDGRADLFIINGNIQDHRAIGMPFAMPTQVFWCREGGGAPFGGGGVSTVRARSGGDPMPRFDDVSEALLSGNLGDDALGRAAAAIDLDNDGAAEIVATFLDRPTAVIDVTPPPGESAAGGLADSESAEGGSADGESADGGPGVAGAAALPDRRRLSVRLVGRHSSRDAVGATLMLWPSGDDPGSQTPTDAADAGRPVAIGYRFTGGYLSTGDPRVRMSGLRHAATYRLRVRWPGGGVSEHVIAPEDVDVVVVQPRAGSIPRIDGESPVGVSDGAVGGAGS